MDLQKRETVLMILGIAITVIVCAICYLAGGTSETVGAPSTMDASNARRSDAGSPPPSSFGGTAKPKAGVLSSTLDVGKTDLGTPTDPDAGPKPGASLTEGIGKN
jgi:hypothetical protein